MAAEKKTENIADAFETVTAATPEFFKEGYEKAAQNVSTLVDFQKSSVEAVIASAGALAKGVEKAASEQTSFAKESFEESVAAAKAAASANSFQDAIAVQNDYVRAAFEKNLGQFNKFADQWMAMTKEVAEPLTTNYGALVEKAQSYRP